MTTKNTQLEAETVDTFLKFCYNFPMDIKDKFHDYYGEHLGEHFYKKFHGYTKKHGNNFIGMIYTFGEMTTNHQETFIKMVNDHYERQKHKLEVTN